LKKTGITLTAVLACAFSCITAGSSKAGACGASVAQTLAASAPALDGGLSGTLWKIVSWATDDEYAGFYNGRIYYVVEGGYSSVDLLEDSFYRDYASFSIGSGVIPERLINFPGDVVIWGILLHRPAIGIGYALPLPAPALLFLHNDSWRPPDED